MADDLALMRAVDQVAGPYLRAFAPTSSVPIAFWAALTANESGVYCLRGLEPRNFPPRFEPAVYAHLCDVIAGKSAAYGSLDSAQLAGGEEAQLHPRTGAFHCTFLNEQFAALKRDDLSAMRAAALRNLASSWGFTQLMGYHAIMWGDSPDDLLDPLAHYGYAAYLTADFSRRFGLDPKSEFREMATCWNAGTPNGRTYDPAYTENLVNRMAAWQRLAEAIPS